MPQKPKIPEGPERDRGWRAGEYSTKSRVEWIQTFPFKPSAYCHPSWRPEARPPTAPSPPPAQDHSSSVNDVHLTSGVHLTWSDHEPCPGGGLLVGNDAVLWTAEHLL